jgi:8-hydroxy-5-deazaflavin:NADPH oxidoreductase
MHCIYGPGLGIVAQGGKQVMLGGEVIGYGPGQSMLTTIDAAKMPRAHVVSAFSTAPSEVLFPVFNGRRRANRPDMVYCGDNATAKRKAARLIRDAGFHPVDLGELKAARNVEPFVLLIAGLAYNRPGGPRVAYRFDRMAR